jgi:c(7)-type cytochrome triheme protein
MLAALCTAAGALAADGKTTYERKCALCHGAGIAGAPRLANAADWAPRVARGKEALYQSALKGTPRGMPPKGGQLDLPDADVRAAVDFMIGSAGPAPKAAAAKPAPASTKPAPAAASAAPAKEAAAPAKDAAAPAPAPAAQATASAPQAAAAAAPAVQAREPGSGAAEANTFNRLLRPAAKRNLPPAEDGIHDPAADGTHELQPPLAAFNALPRSNAGNRVDWVKALAEKKIAPRWDRDKSDAPATVMDLNIVREVKGSMPDVVYPHKQHTEWLDCSNCHPAIFVPQKGANQISMAAILLGEKCGVCHGKVAFPVSECRLCHSRKKDGAAAAAPPAERK